MAGGYYYLVAALPDIAWEAGGPSVAVVDWLAEAEEVLDPEDLRVFRFFRGSYDIPNLLVLLGERKGRWDGRGGMTRGEMEEAVKVCGGPSWMEEFLRARREGRQAVAGMASEDALWWLFTEEAVGHPNGFVSEWWRFERALRNVLAVSSVRREGGSPESVVVGRDEVAEALLRSSEGSLGLMAPWAERLVGASDDWMRREREADRLRWETAEELAALSPFGLEAVLSFFVRFCLAERWALLDPEEGRRMLDRLAEGLARQTA